MKNVKGYFGCDAVARAWF